MKLINRTRLSKNKYVSYVVLGKVTSREEDSQGNPKEGSKLHFI